MAWNDTRRTGSPFSVPLAHVAPVARAVSGDLYADASKAELRALDQRLERLSSQHASSEYNLARRRSLQAKAAAPSTPIAFRRSLNPPSSRSSFTSIIVESPPAPTPAPLTTSRSSTPVYDDAEREEATTPTAKRRLDDGDEKEDGRRTPVPQDRSMSPMREMLFPMDMTPVTPSELPPNTKTSQTHPINLSAVVPPELQQLFGYFLLGPPPAEDVAHSFSLPHFAPSSPPRRGARSPVSSMRTSSPQQQKEPRIVKPCNDAFRLVQHAHHPGHGPIDLWHMTKSMEGNAHNPWTMPLASSTLALAAVQRPPGDWTASIGNLLLSSCPGKKVRLCSPLPRGGRSAICRDLKTDMQAIKDSGVRAIVCCLDNQEMALLGAPWPEYYGLTQEMGLTVYRLPMEEGQAPEGGASVLDATLETVIARHTLRGETVLAHCRGGVGRAGLFACAWALKMNLVSANTLVPALTLVERVVEVIRRRRSVKAIETAAQVKALLDYVHYLRNETRSAKAEEVLLSERL